MSIVKRSLIGLLIPLAVACASSATPRAAGTSNPDVITEAQLAPFAGQTVHYAIQRLRPQFLRTRGPASITNASEGIVVYLGTTRMGGVGSLQQIPAGDIRSVRYLGPSEASQRFGLDHTNGAIVLEPR